MCFVSDWTSDEGEDSADFATMANTAADILHMLSSLEGCEEVLTQLLQQKNLEGYTPFMAAVAYKVREWFQVYYMYISCYGILNIILAQTYEHATCMV